MSNWPLGIVSSAQATGFAGTLWTWGNNNEGQHGDGTYGTQTNSRKSAPTQMGAEENWSRIAQTGANCVFAITTNGKLYSWGAGLWGQNGRGNVVNASVPIQIGDLETWASIAVGVNEASVHAVTTDGKLFAWGKNLDYGHFGNGSHNVPASMSSPVQIGALTNWSSEIGHMAKLSGATIAIKQDGTMWSWGLNAPDGALGLGDVVNRSSPVQIGSDANWTYVVPHFFGFTALKSTGALYSWGNNQYGQAGNGTQGSSHYSSVPIQVGSDSDWSIIGGNHRVLGAIKENGELYMWGAGASGRTGHGDVVSRSVPTQVGALTTWNALHVSGVVTLAQKTDGTMWSWGSSYAGMVGDGTVLSRSSPVQIGSDDGWGQMAGFNDTMAVLQAT